MTHRSRPITFFVLLGACGALFSAAVRPAVCGDLRPEWNVGQKAVSSEDLKVAPPPAAPDELSLSRAVGLALQQNLGFRATLQGLLSARSDWYVASQRWSLEAYGQVQRVSNDDTLTSSRAGAAFSYSAVTGADIAVVAELDRLESDDTERFLTALVNQPLLAGGGRASAAYEEVRQARNNYRAALLAFFIDRQDLIERVVSAYFNTVQQRQLVGIQQASVDRAQQAVEDARLRLDAGQIPEIDLRNAQLRLSREETGAVYQRQAFRDAMDSFLLLLGLEVGGAPELTTPIPEQTQTLDLDPLIAQALELRPDLRLADLALEDREAALRVARSNRLPTLDLVGSWSEVRNETAERDWTLGLDFSLPIGSRFLTEAVRQARWALLVSRQARADLDQEVIADVRRQVRAAEAARANVDIAAASVELSRRSVEIAQRMVEEGLRTNRDLLDAQDDLRQGESSLVSSQIGYYLALVRLRAAVGLDLMEVLPGEEAAPTPEGGPSLAPEASGGT